MRRPPPACVSLCDNNDKPVILIILQTYKVGNELVKRAYLPDLEGRTPELHDEIAVTGWGENAWYTGTTNFRAAGPRRLKAILGIL